MDSGEEMKTPSGPGFSLSPEQHIMCWCRKLLDNGHHLSCMHNETNLRAGPRHLKLSQREYWISWMVSPAAGGRFLPPS